MKIAVFTALGLLLAAFLFVWLVGRIRYRLGSRALKVLFLGLCIRRIGYDSIESISKRRTDGGAEHWWSTMRPKHRILVIRRKRGLFRNVIITPKNRYSFKTDLERAVQRTGNSLVVRNEPADLEPDATTPTPAPAARAPERESASLSAEPPPSPEKAEAAR